jgi:molybdopterin molybdotransferase
LISIEEAQQRLLQLRSPLPTIEKNLADCSGHYLAQDLVALRMQPAADLSAMDGYAVHQANGAGPWQVIGESAAGSAFKGTLASGEAVRIFTGAHVPAGADSVIIQENVTAIGDRIELTVGNDLELGANIRKAGSDFAAEDILLTGGTRVTAGAIAASAMAGYGKLHVGGVPKISIISSGDELRAPGEALTDEQIPSSNAIMLAAMLSGLPCEIRDHGIARDTLPALAEKIKEARGSDIIVTIGGASVGDHDLVQPALKQAGADIDFWRVAIRPGKPMMAGKLGNSVILGLPGNPGSAFVTTFLFLLPLMRHLAGCAKPWPEAFELPCGQDLPKGGPRAEYLRAAIIDGKLRPFNSQDSGMTATLAGADALIIRPVDAPALTAGSLARYLPITV